MNKKNEDVYKIVKILDSETIVINAGSENNIEVEDKFEIFGPGINVEDPDTGESLGTLDNIKETVSVIKVLPKMSICSHISERTSIFSITNSLPSLYSSDKYKKILNVDKEQIMADDDVDKTLKIGDVARKTIPLNKMKSTKN